MKKKWWYLALTGTAVAFLSKCKKEIIVTTGDTQANVISVEGKGEVEAKPNIAYLFVNIITKNEISTIAKEKESLISNNAISSLLSIGLTDKEIQSLNYRINKYRDYSTPKKGKKEWLDIYQVSHQMKVTINDISKITDVLEAVSNIEDIQISNIVYDIKERESLTQEAMKLATKNAQERATIIAETSGTKVKSLNKISVSNHHFNDDHALFESSRMMKLSEATNDMATPINPETQIITVSVHATYNIH